MIDDITSPAHYTAGKIGVRDFILDQQLDWDIGHVVKYVVRYRDKEGIKDLKKARQFLDMRIADLERDECDSARLRIGVLKSRTGYTFSKIQQMVRNLHVKCEFIPLNTGAVIDTRRMERLDFILSIGYMHPIPEYVYDVIPTYNVHPGTLPGLEGKDPQIRALQDGRDVTHVVVHRVTEVIDSGPIEMTHPVCITPEDRRNPDVFTRRMQDIAAHVLTLFIIGQGRRK